MRINAGRWRNALLPRAGPSVRPVPGRLRQSLFSVLADRVEGARVLDLCAGTGALGLEALSRGAASVVLVDSDPRVLGALARWVSQRCDAREARVVGADARRGGWPAGPYDIVFLDPPFSVWEGDGGAALDYVAHAVAAAAPAGVVAVKMPARAPLPTDSRWAVVTRRSMGDVAYTLLVPPSGRASPGAPPG